MIINCTTGKALPLDSLKLYPSRVKKHSLLEINRIVDSIRKDGFLFPIAVGKIGDNNYIIDGEATYLALTELKSQGEDIPEIPIYYIRCNEDSIKKMILVGTSTNHIVTQASLNAFIKDTDIDLHEFGFNEGSLIEFEREIDMSFYKDVTGGKIVAEGIELKPEEFEGLLKL